MKAIPYVDVGGPDGIPEDQRIDLIGSRAMTGNIVGFIVEDENGCEKGDRYIAKLKKKFPQLVVTYRGKLTKLTEIIKIQIPVG